MNVKRFVLACVSVYVAYQVLGFLIHTVFLGDTYGSMASVWRPEAELMSNMWIMYLTSAVWTVLFCYIFTAVTRARARSRVFAMVWWSDS